MARIRSPAHAPAMDPAWQRCRWQRGRDFALEPKFTALATGIFGSTKPISLCGWKREQEYPNRHSHGDDPDCAADNHAEVKRIICSYLNMNIAKQ